MLKGVIFGQVISNARSNNNFHSIYDIVVTF